MTFRVIACAAASFLALSPMAAPEAKALAFLTTVTMTGPVTNNIGEPAESRPYVEIFWAFPEGPLSGGTKYNSDLETMHVSILTSPSDVWASFLMINDGEFVERVLLDVGDGTTSLTADVFGGWSMHPREDTDPINDDYQFYASGRFNNVITFSNNLTTRWGVSVGFADGSLLYTTGASPLSWVSIIRDGPGPLANDNDYWGADSGYISTVRVSDDYVSSVPLPPAVMLLGSALFACGACFRGARRA
ncbi:hypothetical protein P2H44_20325 [Albimonas sp. CAU 1670]|uniref:hypothetical protein n=1 Tax=Albimonas sp. CAU 1670 TaxID=3032599 RepID=UPI0023DB5BEF|nr:hypothetical protein [Albimonas sp. CAU 1670]MDF2234913.1 hypothetical protein [Albimonas sp. CAU 1670]